MLYVHARGLCLAVCAHIIKILRFPIGERLTGETLEGCGRSDLWDAARDTEGVE